MGSHSDGSGPGVITSAPGSGSGSGSGVIMPVSVPGDSGRPPAASTPAVVPAPPDVVRTARFRYVRKPFIVIVTIKETA
ncbi:hypothetical protein GCM10014719_20990 [Planomonospora parontospora subsp. antibiotica]|nr:hypothetical protein GCM10014719_20990 [Planomonospora parontospora subsp. antibiotica]GII15525.1 hypothetical protein Ppa05_22510 [Planomonospora parontospora subsp. antibiotica]